MGVTWEGIGDFVGNTIQSGFNPVAGLGLTMAGVEGDFGIFDEKKKPPPKGIQQQNPSYGNQIQGSQGGFGGGGFGGGVFGGGGTGFMQQPTYSSQSSYGPSQSQFQNEASSYSTGPGFNYNQYRADLLANQLQKQIQLGQTRDIYGRGLGQAQDVLGQQYGVGRQDLTAQAQAGLGAVAGGQQLGRTDLYGGQGLATGALTGQSGLATGALGTQFEKATAAQQPLTTAGGAGFGYLQNLVSQPTELTKQFEYESGLATDALNKQLAARGLSGSGAAIEALSKQNAAIASDIGQRRAAAAQTLAGYGVQGAGNLGSLYSGLGTGLAGQYSSLGQRLGNIYSGTGETAYQGALTTGARQADIYGGLGSGLAGQATDYGSAMANLYGSNAANQANIQLAMANTYASPNAAAYFTPGYSESSSFGSGGSYQGGGGSSMTQGGGVSQFNLSEPNFGFNQDSGLGFGGMILDSMFNQPTNQQNYGMSQAQLPQFDFSNFQFGPWGSDTGYQAPQLDTGLGVGNYGNYGLSQVTLL